MLKPILGTLLALTVVATATARPELNAFINRPANTVPELIAQLRSDPVVMDRFMRHFGMTRSEVLTYVRSLRLGTIRKSGYYEIYSVPEGGRIKVHKSFFKAGTPAFVDASGDPILRIKCGNPFVAGRIVSSLPAPSPEVQSLQDLKPLPDDAVASAVPQATDLLPPPEIAELPDAVAPVPTLPTEPSFNPSGQNFASILAPIAAIGGALTFAGGGRGGGTPVPVPEPATLLALGAGVALLARRRRKN